MGDQGAPAPDQGGKGAETQDTGKKFEKDGDNSLWDGPVKKRCCTDIVCIPIFIAHIFAFWALTFMNAGTGDPMKLIKPRDYKGQFCGIDADGQWNSNMDLKNFEKQMWAMNMDEAFDKVAMQMACSEVGYSAVVGPGVAIGASVRPTANTLTQAQWELYCGKTVSAITVLTDAAAAAQKLTDDVANTVASFTDPSKAAKLFMDGPSSMGTSFMKEMTKYFTQVCTSTCTMSQSTVDANRVYTYSVSANKIWGTDPAYRAIGLWSKFINEVERTQPTLIDQFKFKAWPLSACPYADKHCVPTPGVLFTEVSDWNYCTPQVESGVVDAVAGVSKEAMDGIAKLSVTEDVKKGVGDVIADILKTYDVFIIVAFLSLVLGVAVLVLMRFILAPLVWFSLVLIFLLLVGGGAAVFTRSSQCANQSFSDAANGMSNSLAANTGTSPFDVECAGGYSIENKDARNFTKVASFIILGLAALWLVAVVCMACRIRLAIAINQVACMFIASNPQIILVPILQNIIGILWIIIWVWCASFLLSQVADDNVPTAAYATYDEAFGTSDVAGKCTGTWPAGDVYLDDAASTCMGDAPLCYKCSAPRYWFDWKFGYSFLSFLWHNFFFVAVGQCTIAGAVGIWFFTPKGQKWKRATVLQSLRNAIWYHTGSLAFGSLILAIVVWLKWFMTWLSNQAKQSKNKIMEIVCKCLAYCLWCFEKCVKFLNKNAYIQVALMGTNFCTSAKNAFGLILRNFLRFGVIVALSHIVHFIGMVLITAATAVCGYFILGLMYEDVNPVAPTICYGFIGWFAAKLFIGTFGLAVDATLQCFIAAEEMDAGNDFAPDALKNFIKEKEGEKGGACDSCCCVVL